MNRIIPPENLSELLERANMMAGVSLAQIASQRSIRVPKDLKRNKGWVGQLIEMELGATAGSKPEQDFLHLGVELKTIPIDTQGRPLETTYVCVAPLSNIQGLTWQNSLVCHKLQRVLWVPVEGERHIPVGERRIGTPILWEPDPHELQLLQQDWEEIMELIALGKVERLTARHGEVLQLRPKAANSKALTQSIAEDGSLKMTNPRGFYLKTSFTAIILNKVFG
ncbi:MAG: DNA mismatch repair endonuclease MutH [Shewanella sp.]|uniref:DNA mismatch repair endonuclease MutH n=1 Tax=unclassified Shewanella TaxID=196818 RepID=UPI001B551E24|nr:MULTISPECIES: DNA mismatch repair endonuclease MutH [unclassified Shewanella]MBP7662882.1 DNA mismatch repair endonuclease MutH [Shewanella sp.]MCU8006811.1 DNA mismatch repair endonuclease MutH [Shewanella sp. SM87]MCU8054617.1 DNA mismatch repair endonuclease MutH [Shewanella sp. SM35]MCU8061248.1 DNA mismatch repair endonuclease MutH [Shewanella sp. SM55]MCU8064138.1 DNA mismatch repair endonuclease MutH [Shewanella sp. SM34]